VFDIVQRDNHVSKIFFEDHFFFFLFTHVAPVLPQRVHLFHSDKIS
jgi:hypothetical protein